MAVFLHFALLLLSLKFSASSFYFTWLFAMKKLRNQRLAVILGTLAYFGAAMLLKWLLQLHPPLHARIMANMWEAEAQIPFKSLHYVALQVTLCFGMAVWLSRPREGFRS